jgi:hypothetical protein
LLDDGWYLKSYRAPVPPVPHVGRECQYEINRRFILLLDLHKEPPFTLDSYNWSTFRTSEFHPCRHASYLGGVDLFNRERGVGLDEEEEDEDEIYDGLDEEVELLDKLDHRY